jgi:hypothetical protein
MVDDIINICVLHWLLVEQKLPVLDAEFVIIS